MKFYLASSSPRRKELFSLITDDFSIVSPDIEEKEYPEKTARMKCVRRAKDKCIAAVNKIKDKESVIVSADTLVDFNGCVFDKPKDSTEAYGMIKKLSANSHFVHTAVCVYKDGVMYSFCDDTEVFFKRIPDEVISEYVKTPEPYDKAGAYAIQGFMAKYVKKISGDYDTVVGLPARRLKILIDKLCG